MRRRRKAADPFPAPLREFVESEWPRLPGECLGIFGCHGEGYGADCVPRPGEWCGQLYYEALARDCPGRPGVLAAAVRADAYIRWKEARLSWLGEDHPGWLGEFLDSAEHEIRYAPFRDGRQDDG